MSEVAIVAGLLLRYGPEVAKFFRDAFAKKTPPTAAEWAELDAILQKTGESYFTKVTP